MDHGLSVTINLIKQVRWYSLSSVIIVLKRSRTLIWKTVSEINTKVWSVEQNNVHENCKDFDFMNMCLVSTMSIQNNLFENSFWL